MVTTVYIVRHCQSMGNIEKRFQGRFDAPVSPDGEKQLDLLALRFRNVHLDAVYSSPLTRAFRTAEAANRFHQLPIQKMDGLSEIDVGEMENLPLTEIGKAFPEVAYYWDAAPERCCFPGGETMEQVYTRVNAALDEILRRERGRTVFVATHGGVLRSLYARIAFGGLEGIGKSAVFGNTGVSILEQNEAGQLTWKLVNDLSHLPEELRRSPTVYRFQGETV